jgi:hypothetical protein
MIARTKTAKKEKLKDIIDAVAAKQSLLKPLPDQTQENFKGETAPLEKANVKVALDPQQPEVLARKSERGTAAKEGQGPLRNFWNGLCWSLGAITAAALLALAAIYLSTKLMFLPDLAVKAATVLSFILGIISSWNF